LVVSANGKNRVYINFNRMLDHFFHCRRATAGWGFGSPVHNR
jgi:hypothetical protein